LIAVIGALLISSGCQRGAKSGSDGKRIGITLLTREHEFYRQLEAGLKDAADKQGYQLIITSGDFDLAKQQSQIENFIVQGVDAIIDEKVNYRIAQDSEIYGLLSLNG
jgi:ribose transport system substrate-binding protein